MTFLGRGSVTKTRLSGPASRFLLLEGGGLVLGFLLPRDPDPLFWAGAAVHELPELTGGLDAMSAQLLAHPGVSNIGVEGLITSSSLMQGMVFIFWVKRWMNLRRVSPGSSLKSCRSLGTPERWYPP